MTFSDLVPSREIAGFCKTGFKDDATQAFWGRPACMLQMPDGSLLLSDEQLGAIYRISYAK